MGHHVKHTSSTAWLLLAIHDATLSRLFGDTTRPTGYNLNRMLETYYSLTVPLSIDFAFGRASGATHPMFVLRQHGHRPLLLLLLLLLCSYSLLVCCTGLHSGLGGMDDGRTLVRWVFGRLAPSYKLRENTRDGWIHARLVGRCSGRSGLGLASGLGVSSALLCARSFLLVLESSFARSLGTFLRLIAFFFLSFVLLSFVQG